AENVTFRAVGCGDEADGVSFSWDFGDGSPRVNGAEADHAFFLAANRRAITFTVRLFVDDGVDVCSVTHTISVHPTFTDVFPIFSNRCAGCHTAARPFFVSTEQATYDDMVATIGCGTTPIIVPKSTTLAAHSLAGRLRLEGENCGGQMPPGALLPQSEQDLIRDWLLGGAER